MARQSKAQKETVERVMHEFKHGALESSGGRTVKNPRQAIAIALHEAGASRDESPETNRRTLRRTKRRERAEDAAGPGRSDGESKAALYAEAKRRGIPGRSRMNKDDLRRALQAA